MARKFGKLTLPKSVLIRDGRYVVVKVVHEGRTVAREQVGTLTDNDADNRRLLQDAEAKVAQIRESIRSGKLGIEARTKKVLVVDACEMYWNGEAKKKPSHKTFRIFLDRIREKFPSLYLHEANYTHTIALREWLGTFEWRGHPMKASTINRYHTCWTRLFNYFKDQKRLKVQGYADVELPEFNPGSPIRSKPETHKVNERRFRRRRVVTMEEFAIFYKLASPRVRDICKAALLTTLRRNDLKQLNDDVKIDTVTGTAYGVQGKVNKDFEVPVVEDVEKVLGKLDWTNFRREFEEARDKAVGHGVPYFLFKDLRKSAPTILRRMGYDTRTQQEILGHASSAMTEIYTPVEDQEKKEAMENVAKLFHKALESEDTKLDTEGLKNGAANPLKRIVNQ